ncbi:MAG: alpha-ribazole phosphatase [Bacteroidaceae bacterium]|nr:alpha-ribazole phosphatase [Bacteroidaceae bacterium]
MKVYLVRHTSVCLPKGTCYGWSDVGLNDTFQAEADSVLRALPQDIRFDAVYTSPLTRCVRLAEYCGHPDAVPDVRLKEMNFGDWELKPYDNITGSYAEQWYNDYLNMPAPGGESFRQLYARVAEFLDSLKNRQDIRNVLVFAHGGVLACAGIYSGEVRFENAFSSAVPYGGMTVIEI